MIDLIFQCLQYGMMLYHIVMLNDNVKLYLCPINHCLYTQLLCPSVRDYSPAWWSHTCSRVPEGNRSARTKTVLHESHISMTHKLVRCKYQPVCTQLQSTTVRYLAPAWPQFCQQNLSRLHQPLTNSHQRKRVIEVGGTPT